MQVIVDQATPYSQTFQGKAERGTYEFRTLPEQIPGERWLADQIIQRNSDEIAKQGCHLLHIKVWRDVGPTFYTDYRVEVISTASPVFWTPIILGVLAIMALVISWKLIEVVKDIDWGKIPGAVSWSMPIVAGTGLLIAILLLRKFR